MIRRLIILLLIVGWGISQNNIGSQVRFNPDTGEIIDSDSSIIFNSSKIIFDPYTGQQITHKNSDEWYESIQSNKDIINYESNLLTTTKSSVQSIIFFYPVFSSTIKNERNEVIGTKGIAPLFIGYYKKNYYKPAKINSWSPYWHWGTIGLIFPYIGIGTDYINDNGFYFGIGTIYWVPSISVGKYF